jgi:hypothetical protein
MAHTLSVSELMRSGCREAASAHAVPATTVPAAHSAMTFARSTPVIASSVSSDARIARA